MYYTYMIRWLLACRKKSVSCAADHLRVKRLHRYVLILTILNVRIAGNFFPMNLSGHMSKNIALQNVGTRQLLEKEQKRVSRSMGFAT